MYRPFIIFSAAVTLLLAACSQPAGTSDFKLLLTDAPADEASALIVVFGEVQLLLAEDEAEPVVVSDLGGTFDVLKLRNGETALLGEANIPDGSYSQLRVIVESATITIDGEDQPVKIPSGAQSGLKINIEPPLEALGGQRSSAILDFNASRVIETGNGSYQMGPTAIRATSVSSTLSGTLQDADDNPLVGGLVAVTDASGAAITEAVSGADGIFKIITLTQGEYTVTVSLEGFESRSFEVSITANESAMLTEDGVIALSSAAQ